MARKLKATGFTRFFIAMLFIVPIAYLVASYANGEDALGNIKDMVVNGERTETTVERSTKSVDTCDELQQQVEEQQRRIEALERENEKLKNS